MATVVYLLCALTSAFCALLLFWKFRRRRTKLLLWSSLSFGCVALCNAVVFADFVLVPDLDLSVLRSSLAAIGSLLLVFGLVWDLE